MQQSLQFPHHASGMLPDCPNYLDRIRVCLKIFGIKYWLTVVWLMNNLYLYGYQAHKE
jgi:hypothetical protein